MAINFEAANMAGYNNPKIEVFEAIYPAEGSTLIDFPSKSVILDCIKRGAVPVLVATDTNRTEMYILYLCILASSADGYTISFSTSAKPTPTDPPVIISIFYDRVDSNAPTIAFDAAGV